MKLPVGTRLPHDFLAMPSAESPELQRNQPLYRVTQVIHESAWGGLYQGKKIFRNFQWTKGVVEEVPDDECLDVLIRTVGYTKPQDRATVQAARDRAWFEAKRVFGCRGTNLIPEPLGYVEVRNDQDVFTFSKPGRLAATEPILVFEQIHGDNLAKWRLSQKPDVVRCLRVLCELLDFVSTLHEQGLIANGLSPAGLWIDEIDQAHFVSTENVIDEKQATEWRLLFPPERYPQGFIAPELMNPTRAPSRQSDLYGWALLAWFLITGDSPARLAMSQQRRWAAFDETHRVTLHQILKQVPASAVRELKDRLKISGSRFERLWPDSFLFGISSCLEVPPAQRPGSVEDLRNWWAKSPPPPIPCGLDLRDGTKPARLVYSLQGLPAGATIHIVQRLGDAAWSLAGGTAVWRGTGHDPRDIPLPPKSNLLAWHHSLFVVDTTDGIESASRATVARVVDATVPGYRRLLAESLLREGSSGRTSSSQQASDSGTAIGARDIPEEIILLTRLAAPIVVAAELFASEHVTVRGWGLQLLERMLSPTRTADGPIPIPEQLTAARSMLRHRIQQDSDRTLRGRAAGIAFRMEQPQSATRLQELARLLGGPGVDDQIRAARSLRSEGVPDDIVEAALKLIEGERLIPCRVCQTELRARDADAHLVTEHGYVALDDEVLPFGDALRRLWGRVVSHFDRQAVATLWNQFAQRHSQLAAQRFAESFAMQTLLACQIPRETNGNTTPSWMERLADCVASHPQARDACRAHLAHSDRRLREIARGMWERTVAQDLSHEETSLVLFRRAVEQLVPERLLAPANPDTVSELVDERIDVCHRLVDLGANAFTASACEEEFDQERLQSCPDCGEVTPKRSMPRHRRRTHQIYELDGSRCSWEELLRQLTERSVTTEPDPHSARSLVELLEERDGHDAVPTLLSLLETEFRRQKKGVDREALLQGIGSSFGSLPVAVPLIRAAWRTAGDEKSKGLAPGLAFATFAHLPESPPLDVCRELAKGLSREAVPFGIRRHAAVQLVRHVDQHPDACRTGLRALAQSLNDKLAGIDMLRALEQWTGPASVIDSVCDEIESSIKMKCPQCDVVLTRLDLIEHLRHEHRLLLEGRSVRRPWAVALDRLEEFTVTSRPELLKEAEELAILGDPDRGQIRFVREALQRGIDPGDYQLLLLSHAAETKSSVCPHCFHAVTPLDRVPDLVRVDGIGTVTTEDFVIRAIGTPGLWGACEITGTQGPWHGPVPDWKPTRQGRALAGAYVFLAPAMLFVVLATMGATWGMNVAYILGVMGVAASVIMALWPASPPEEPIDAVWTNIVPPLLKEGLTDAEGMFLASLARKSCQRGHPKVRQASLLFATTAATLAVRNRTLAPGVLGELVHLQLDDAFRNRRHVAKGIEGLGNLLVSCLRGELPLVVLDRATRDGSVLSFLEFSEFMGLATLLFDRFQESGASPTDVIQLTGRSPTINVLLKTTGLVTHHEISKRLTTNAPVRGLGVPIRLDPRNAHCSQCKASLIYREGQLSELA